MWKPLLLLLGCAGIASAQTMQPSFGPVSAGPAPPPTGTTYYVSAAGNNGNNGTSPATSWQTLSKVAATTLNVGDSVLFNGGDTFSGASVLNTSSLITCKPTNCKGTSAFSVTFGSYGVGNATLNDTGNGTTFSINTNGVIVQNLTFNGNGTALNGIDIINNSSPAVNYSNVTVQSNTLSGYTVRAILSSSTAVIHAGLPAGWSNLNILNNTIDGTGQFTNFGIFIAGGFGTGKPRTQSNILVQGNIVSNIPGQYGLAKGNSGNGILLAQTTHGISQFNITHDIGANVRECGGPAGNWAFDADNVVFQFNEAYNVLPSIAPTRPVGVITQFGTIVGGSGGANGTYTNVALTGGSGAGATADITVAGGAVTAIVLRKINLSTGYVTVVRGAITGGSGGANATYTNVPITGGSGTGMTATIVVSGGSVTGVTIANPGINYAAANTLSASSGNIGGVTGFSFILTTPADTISAVSGNIGNVTGFFVPVTTVVNTCDWNGFDCDGFTAFCTIQYSYAHDNGGNGAEYFGSNSPLWHDNTIRYNVFERNDALNQQYGNVYLQSNGSSFTNTSVYNNTMYSSSSNTSVGIACVGILDFPSAITGLLIANNLCYSLNNVYTNYTFFTSPPTMTLTNNNYFNTGGFYKFKYGVPVYTTFATYKAGSGQDATTTTVNPLLVAPGGGGTCGAPQTPTNCPGAYKLQHGSAMIGTGLNLTQAPYNLNVGTIDYFGDVIPHGVGTGYNIGADGANR